LPTTKTGEKITWKEFFHRWKNGMNGITPLQQVNIQINSTWITIIGLLAGITICIIGIKTLWWLLLILIGGLGNTLMQQLGAWQRKKMLMQFDSAFNIATINQEQQEVKKNGL
jgi:hypothetical protein